MRPTQLPYVIDALITLFRTTGITVLDGPAIASEEMTEFIVVGDESDDSSGESTFTQDWAGLGAGAKDDEGSVSCTIVVQAGDDDLKTRRLRAFTILGLCEAAQRGNLSLSGIVIFSAIRSGTYQPVSNERGTAARVGFIITY